VVQTTESNLGAFVAADCGVSLPPVEIRAARLRCPFCMPNCIKETPQPANRGVSERSFLPMDLTTTIPPALDNVHDKTVHSVQANSPESEASTGGRFVQVPICLLGAVPPETIATYLAIGGFADFQTHDGAFPSLRTLADQIGIGKSTVERHVEKLAAAGALNVTPGDPRTRRPNLYRLEDPCGTCWQSARETVPPAPPESPTSGTPLSHQRDIPRHQKPEKNQNPPNPPNKNHPEQEPEGGEDSMNKNQTATTGHRKTLQERATAAGVDFAEIRRQVIEEKANGANIRSIERVTKYRVEAAIEDAKASAHDLVTRKLDLIEKLGGRFDSLADWREAIGGCIACDPSGKVHLRGLMISPASPSDWVTPGDPEKTWDVDCPHTAEWQTAAANPRPPADVPKPPEKFPGESWADYLKRVNRDTA